jgi:hypothetical protein
MDFNCDDAERQHQRRGVPKKHSFSHIGGLQFFARLLVFAANGHETGIVSQYGVAVRISPTAAHYLARPARRGCFLCQRTSPMGALATTNWNCSPWDGWNLLFPCA